MILENLLKMDIKPFKHSTYLNNNTIANCVKTKILHIGLLKFFNEKGIYFKSDYCLDLMTTSIIEGDSFEDYALLNEFSMDFMETINSKFNWFNSEECSFFGVNYDEIDCPEWFKNECPDLCKSVRDLDYGNLITYGNKKLGQYLVYQNLQADILLPDIHNKIMDCLDVVHSLFYSNFGNHFYINDNTYYISFVYGTTGDWDIDESYYNYNVPVANWVLDNLLDEAYLRLPIVDHFSSH